MVVIGEVTHTHVIECGFMTVTLLHPVFVLRAGLSVAKPGPSQDVGLYRVAEMGQTHDEFTPTGRWDPSL
jgi:hypothetical protein